MKKKLPCITLNRETLFQLDPSLKNVAGGYSVPNTQCGTVCSRRNTCDNYTACA